MGSIDAGNTVSDFDKQDITSKISIGTSIIPVEYEGNKIVPLKFLKAVLPEPASLGPLTQGRTCIGCLMKGVKDGKKKEIFIYNICSHEESYKEVGSQAISYTTGVPAMIGAMMMLEKKWHKAGVWNMEQFDPDPFMDALNKYGLPWSVDYSPGCSCQGLNR